MVDTVRTLAEFQALLHPNIKNAMPDATVLQSQTARDLLISLPSLAGGGAYILIDGVNYPATGAGIRAAYAVLVALNGGLGKIEIAPFTPIAWGTAEPLNIIAGGFEFYAPDNSPISKPASAYAFTPICANIPAGTAGVVTPVTNGTGVSGSAVALTLDFVRDTNLATCAAVPAAIVVGDYVQFVQTNVPIYESDFAWITKVIAKSATTITLEDSAPMPITVANSATFQKIVLLENVKITCRVLNNGNTGTTAPALGNTCGVRVQYLVRSLIDVKAQDTVSAGFWMQQCYRMDKVHAIAEGCGQPADCGIFTAYCNLCIDLNLLTRNSFSAGIINRGCVYKGGVLESQTSNGRNIKNHHVWRSWFERAIGNFAQAPGAGGSTGIETTGSSDDVTYLYAEAIGNWSSGFYNAGPALSATNVRTIAGTSRGNGIGGGGSADIDMNAGAVSWYFGSGVDFSTLSDLSSKLSILGYLASVAHAGGNFTANNGATWTVQLADQTYFKYTMLTPTMMEVTVVLAATAITVATPTILSIAIPNGRLATGSARAPVIATEAGVPRVTAWAIVDNGYIAIQIVPDLAGGVWAIGAMDLSLTIQIPVAA